MRATMRAQVLEAPGKLVYRQVPVPECRADEVLVRVLRAAICNGSDPPIYDGVAGYAMPLVFGHEPVGVIERCGEAVIGLKVGDRVSWWFSHGAFAEYVAVAPAGVAMAVVPPGIGDCEAPLVEPLIASGRAVWAAGARDGLRILILGLGPCGTIMAQWAKASGAARVAGWDLHATRRKLAETLGTDAAFDPRGADVAAQTREAVGEVDAVIDAMGDDVLPGEPTLDAALSLLKRDGLVVSFGHPPNGRRFNPALFQSTNASIRGPIQPLDDVRAITAEGIGHVLAGRVKLLELVSTEIPLSQVAAGIELVRTRPNECMKVMVDTQP